MHGTCLHLAMHTFDIDIIKTIISKGGSVNSLDIQKNTPLAILLSIFDKNPANASEISKILIDIKSTTN